MASQYLATVRVNPVLLHPDERRQSLSGEWRFRLDPGDRGLQEKWHENIDILRGKIAVPGTWQGQGFGSDDPEVIWDFRLEARTLRATYTGTAWYGRRFLLPEGWAGSRVCLNLGGVHPSADLWLNGVKLGEHHAPFVPFGLEITDLIRPGQENTLAVRVYEANRDLGLSFNWQGNWSGLYRDVELTATGPSFFERFWVRPNGERLSIASQIGGTLPLDEPLVLRVVASAIGHDEPAIVAEAPVDTPEVAVDVPIPSPWPWSPDAPNLYRVDAQLLWGEQVHDALSERVGFVQLSTEGKRFLINGEPYYMRGTGEFLSNPETASPDTDRDRWRKKLGVLRDYGYNYVRCQSFVPAPEYFDVADEVGLLVQSEMGMLGGWGGHTQWHVYQWPQPTADYYQQLKWQWDRVVMRDMNHPSANIYCMSNELGSNTNFPRVAWQCYHDTKALKKTAMVIWTDGGYSEDLPADFINAHADLDEECSKPLIQHEFRWWSSFPDVRTMAKYSGAVRPYGAEIALEAAARHGISHVLPVAAAASQRLQFLEAKGKMEICRRDNPRLAGICHFSAMDGNPSPQGIVDEFYDPKVADAATWRQTNGDTVILASLGFDDRNLGGGDVLRCNLFVSDFSHPPLQHPSLSWRMVAADKTLASGRESYRHQAFCTCPAGSLEVTIPDRTAPCKARLQTTLEEGDRRFTNQWDFFLFPQNVELPGGVFLYGPVEHTWLRTLDRLPVATEVDLEPSRVRVALAERLDQTLIAYMRAGGRVILAASEGLLRPFRPKFGHTVGHYFFTPPANYPPYEDGHDGTIIADSAMLGGFPHEGFADLQFFRLITNHAPLDLDPLGLNVGDPVMRVMHSYPVSHPIAYLDEFRLGQGGIILDALNLDQSLIEARYLLVQMCNYASGDAFNPAKELPEEAVGLLLAGMAIP